MLLEVDQEYRGKATCRIAAADRAQALQSGGQGLAPNPPYGTSPWHFTALYSNTVRAHELGKTSDWVVIFYSSDHRREGQCTVVTETTGPWRGLRVVRSRERECAVL